MRSLLEIDQSRHLWPYIQIARIDHWFKNVFMLLGVLLALFYEPALFTWAGVLRVGVALLAACLVASSNYVLNELLDASGVGIAWLINPCFMVVALALWVMGVVYNVPPVRTKELPYLDVLSES